MRKLVMYMMSTLNGYGGDPGNEMYWATVSEQTWEFVAEMRESCDAAVLGAKTYQEFLNFWPGAADDESNSPGVLSLARWMRDSEKLVFSKNLDKVDPTWPNTRLLRDVTEIAEVKDAPGKNILILGGIGIANALAQNDLIDEFWIHVNPSTIPDGRLLLNTRLDLKLLEARPFESGVVVLHYARA